MVKLNFQHHTSLLIQSSVHDPLEIIIFLMLQMSSKSLLMQPY